MNAFNTAVVVLVVVFALLMVAAFELGAWHVRRKRPKEAAQRLAPRDSLGWVLASEVSLYSVVMMDGLYWAVTSVVETPEEFRLLLRTADPDEPVRHIRQAERRMYLVRTPCELALEFVKSVQ